MLTVVRSPAKVCWHLKCNGIFIEPFNTKAEAIKAKATYERKYGV